MDWYCIQIDHPRLVITIDVTFRKMLIAEYLAFGEPKSCRVYRKAFPDKSYCYFLSPEAADTFRAFVNFWEGIAVSEPTNLLEMEVII